jgi:hypothetical protein
MSDIPSDTVARRQWLFLRALKEQPSFADAIALAMAVETFLSADAAAVEIKEAAD